jgi:UDP-N-acetylglucosamine transferase subunit ALG13
MVGMHTTGFDRLVEALDIYAGSHSDVKLRVQTGSGKYSLRHGESFSFRSELVSEAAWADLVVGQASVSLLEVLKAGKPVVIVPRQKIFGEALDDHQVRFGQVLSERLGWPLVMEMEGLALAISAAFKRTPPVQKDTPHGLVAALGEHLRRLKEAQSKKI